MPDPAVSVVVLAHLRREYVAQAVGSVEANATDPGEVERILVKAFPDASLDDELHSRGWNVLTTDLGPLGAKVALGVERASGPVVTFLEDDDLYEPGRLSAVLGAFEGNPGLGFFRNAHTFIGPDGRPIPSPGRSTAGENLSRVGTLTATAEQLPRLLPELVRVDPDFNLSAIAVRRALLLPRLDEIRSMAAAVDSGVFFSVLRARGTIQIDARPLTRYRVHEGNLSLLGTSGEARARFLEHQRLYLDAFRPVYLACRREGPRAAMRLSGTAYFGTRLLYDVLADGATRRRIGEDLLGLWRSAPFAALNARRDWMFYGSLALISRSMARGVYLRRRSLPNS